MLSVNFSIDGGVSNNDFVCQTLADLTRLDVERPASAEMTALGVAFIAGLKTGETGVGLGENRALELDAF